MERKTSELTGAALDWAVADCAIERDDFGWRHTEKTIVAWDKEKDEYTTYSPSTDWSQGGPIIEREGIGLDFSPPEEELQPAWIAVDRSGAFIGEADKPLIAAMRCYIASKLGDTVTIPDELC